MQQLLIDGHNLIAQVPGLSLADPDDEQKLVALLRTYAQRKRAKIVVVFDSGLPGGESRELSGGGVTAIFAGSHTIADRILIERIRELKRPSEWSVVSSDREVQQAADRREMLVRSSPEFASMLLAPPKRPANERPVMEDPLSKDEVNEWLQMFKQRRPK
jgi:predicted RNA-binding protein with PIN domain